jgi:hypothetical protein
MERIVTMEEKQILEKALWMLAEEFIMYKDNGQITRDERARLIQYKVLETINKARRKISGTNK